jgi:hypothetical protein
MKNALNLSLTALAIAASLACPGSDDGPGGATKLTYTDPAQGDYKLVTVGDAGVSVTLALRGPSSVRARGVNFGLSLDAAKAAFAPQEGGNFAMPGGALDLDSGGAPRIFRAALDPGSGNLRVSMAQKGNAVPARPLNGDIATVTVRLQAGVQKGAVALSPLEAKVLLENGDVVPVQVQVGTLEAQ